MSAASHLRHDASIARMVSRGAAIRQIADAVGARYQFVYRRVGRLGLLSVALENARRLNAEHRRARRRSPMAVGYRGSRVVEALPPTRVDRSASNLVRALRTDRAALERLDHSHMIACFHVAGLTLEDIEDRLGVPPVEAVAAIRRAHCGVHP